MKRLSAERQLAERLHHMGLTSQQAAFVSDKRDEKEPQRQQRTWERQTCSSIVQRARELNAVILFGDEVSCAQWGSLART